MKDFKFGLFAAILLGFNLALAETTTVYLEGSEYEQRHQKMLFESALESCKVNGGKAIQISSKEEVIMIDNGKFDYIYDTVIELTVQIDQGVWDVYVVDIQSLKSDMYDHNDKDWGAYSINYSTCYQEKSR